MLRSNSIKINQNNQLINQNSRANNIASQQSADTRLQTKAIKEQTKSLDNVANQINESNKPTVTIKLEEYNRLLNQNDDYQKLLDSVECVESFKSPISLSTNVSVLIDEGTYLKLIYDILKAKNQLIGIDERTIREVELQLIPSRKR